MSISSPGLFRCILRFLVDSMLFRCCHAARLDLATISDSVSSKIPFFFFEHDAGPTRCSKRSQRVPRCMRALVSCYPLCARSEKKKSGSSSTGARARFCEGPTHLPWDLALGSTFGGFDLLSNFFFQGKERSFVSAPLLLALWLTCWSSFLEVSFLFSFFFVLFPVSLCERLPHRCFEGNATVSSLWCL